MAHDGDLLPGERPHRLVAAACQHGVGAPGHRRDRSAQNLVGGHGLGEAERGGDEDALRALAHGCDMGGAADDHLDARRFGRGRLLRRLGRHLRGLPARASQRAQTRDRLAALDVAAAEIEDARHQAFLSFLA